MKRTSHAVCRSSFTTCFLGSAGENRERLRNIVTGGEKRSGRWLFPLSILITLFCCFFLVSCRTEEGERTTLSAQPTDAKPVFSLTGPGEETVPFSNLLGLQGTVRHEVTEDGNHWYTYQAQLGDGTSFELADTSGAVFHLDLDGDGQMEPVDYDASVGSICVWRRWPDGSIRKQELGEAAANHFGPKGEPWRLVNLTFHPEDTTVTISSAEKEETVPLSLLLEEARSGSIVLAAPDAQNPEGTPLSTVLPFGTYSVFYEKLNLDGEGEEDDSLIVTCFDYDSPQGALAVAEATLGTGATLTWTCDDTGSPNILPAHLISAERQSIVLRMLHRATNNGAAAYYILDAENGVLTEKARLGTMEGADSGDLAPDDQLQFDSALDSRPDGLDTLRISTMYPDKWHTRYGSLFWDGAELVWETDTRFIDTESLTLADGRELTVKLSGPVSQLEESDYYNPCYDLVEIWDGDTLLQTITPSLPLPEPYVFDEDTKREITILEENYLPGFSAAAMLHNVDIRDINFDGSEDLGLPCNSTHYDPHAWYVWDGANQQFRYALSLEGYPTIDTEEQRIIEHRFEEGDQAYSFNARGQLVWMGPTDTLEESPIS